MAGLASSFRRGPSVQVPIERVALRAAAPLDGLTICYALTKLGLGVTATRIPVSAAVALRWASSKRM